MPVKKVWKLIECTTYIYIFLKQSGFIVYVALKSPNVYVNNKQEVIQIAKSHTTGFGNCDFKVIWSDV